MSLKRYFPDIRFGSNKVDPDEINVRFLCDIMYPSIGTATIGTLAAGTVAAAMTVVNTVCDYPRNLLFTVVGPAGGVGGTCAITGKDQFGASQTENVTIASANAGGTKAGTKVFDSVSAAYYYPNGVNNTSTATLGYAFGTSSTLAAKFGLPVRLGAYTDVKRITWIDNGAVTAINGGTIGTAQTAGYVSTATSSFMGTHIVAATDIYRVSVISSYNGENDAIYS